MLLLMVAAIGFIVGRQLGAGRRGFVTMAVVSIGTAVVQITHLAITSDRSAMTMLPLVIGTVVVAGMLLGAFVRRPKQSSTAA
jgi:hypothetical protein